MSKHAEKWTNFHNFFAQISKGFKTSPIFDVLIGFLFPEILLAGQILKLRREHTADGKIFWPKFKKKC